MSTTTPDVASAGGSASESAPPAPPEEPHPSGTPSDAPRGSTRRPLDRWAPLAAGLLLAAPILIARYPPMTDLPHYEAVISILRYRNDPARFPPGLYELNLGHPNQLLHVVAWGLSYVMPTDWALKLTIAATVVAITLGAARLAKHLGASPWLAVVVAPIALGWTFYWGLGTNLVGLAALLFMLPVLDQVAHEPTWRRAALGAGAMVLLYFAHEAMMVISCVAVVIFALTQPLTWRTPLRLSPAAVASVLFVAQIWYQERLKSPALAAVPTSDLPLKRKLVDIPATLVGGHDSYAQYLLCGLFLVTMLVFAWLARRERRRTAQVFPDFARLVRVRRLAYALRFELFGVAAMGMYFAMPFTANGATMVYQRFLAPAYAVLAIALGRHGARAVPRIAKVFASVAPVSMLLVAWPQFADADRAYRELDRMLPQIAMGSAVAPIEVATSTEGRMFSAAAGGTRVVAIRGGRTMYSMTDSTISPVRVARGYEWNEPLTRTLYDSHQLRPAHDLKRFRYVLAHVPGGLVSEGVIRALAPEARVVDRSGEWILFESKLELVPLKSPDVPLPQDPRPMTLRKRMRLALDEMIREGVAVRRTDVPPEETK